MITMDDLIDSLSEAIKINEVRKKIDQREDDDFTIQSLTTRMFSNNGNYFSETKINYKDPHNDWDSEDIVIIMQLFGNKWKVIRIDKAELGS